MCVHRVGFTERGPAPSKSRLSRVRSLAGWSCSHPRSGLGEHQVWSNALLPEVYSEPWRGISFHPGGGLCLIWEQKVKWAEVPATRAGQCSDTSRPAAGHYHCRAPPRRLARSWLTKTPTPCPLVRGRCTTRPARASAGLKSVCIEESPESGPTNGQKRRPAQMSPRPFPRILPRSPGGSAFQAPTWNTTKTFSQLGWRTWIPGRQSLSL